WRLMSVRTLSRVRVKKWVEPIQALMVPNGCSTVCRRTPMASGIRSKGPKSPRRVKDQFGVASDHSFDCTKVRKTPSVLRHPCDDRHPADCGGLFVEPPVFAAIAVEDAVDHYRRTLDVRLPAGRNAGMEDDRPGDIFGQLALDRPQYL